VRVCASNRAGGGGGGGVRVLAARGGWEALRAAHCLNARQRLCAGSGRRRWAARNGAAARGRLARVAGLHGVSRRAWCEERRASLHPRLAQARLRMPVLDTHTRACARRACARWRCVE
jgi:hypothetical protein